MPNVKVTGRRRRSRERSERWLTFLLGKVILQIPDFKTTKETLCLKLNQTYIQTRKPARKLC